MQEYRFNEVKFNDAGEGTLRAGDDDKVYVVKSAHFVRADYASDTTGVYVGMLTRWEGIVYEYKHPDVTFRLTLQWRDAIWGPRYWTLEPVVLFRREYVTPEKRDEILRRERQEAEWAAEAQARREEAARERAEWEAAHPGETYTRKTGRGPSRATHVVIIE